MTRRDTLGAAKPKTDTSQPCRHYGMPGVSYVHMFRLSTEIWQLQHQLSPSLCHVAYVQFPWVALANCGEKYLDGIMLKSHADPLGIGRLTNQSSKKPKKVRILVVEGQHEGSKGPWYELDKQDEGKH